jgi:hypothetical protein
MRCWHTRPCARYLAGQIDVTGSFEAEGMASLLTTRFVPA